MIDKFREIAFYLMVYAIFTGLFLWLFDSLFIGFSKHVAFTRDVAVMPMLVCWVSETFTSLIKKRPIKYSEKGVNCEIKKSSISYYIYGSLLLVSNLILIAVFGYSAWMYF